MSRLVRFASYFGLGAFLGAMDVYLVNWQWWVIIGFAFLIQVSTASEYSK